MTIYGRSRLETALLEAGAIDADQLEKAAGEHRASGRRISRILVENGALTEDQLLAVLDKYFGIPAVNPDSCRPAPELAALIPAETALRLRVIPLEAIEGRITLAMADPLDLAAADDVAMLTGAEITPVAARESSINYLINRLYGLDETGEAPPGSGAASAGGAKKNLSAGRAAGREDEGPVIRMVNALIERAIDEGASDIHLEPADEHLRVRMRLDGILHDLASLPGHMGPKIISRVKILANLDIAERRLPQDGNIEWKGRQTSNLRISTLPAIRGEKAVIRLLGEDKIVLPLDKLGFSKRSYETFLGLLLNHAGLLLVTGPTGCGKTTTLYSALHYLNRPRDNIITVEDPVEYRLKGINQVQVNQRINRTFSNALRSILRQDPDIIMVGEIRDLETARLTVQAAFTGHLVLSTLHTNNAAGAITRLTDMGLENYLVTSSLVGVISQRLVRKICPHCTVDYSPEDDEKYLYSCYFREEPPARLRKGKKCGRCNHTGYRGRTAIQEILVPGPDIQELVLQGAAAETLQKTAVRGGMVPLVRDGLRCVKAGVTTVNEVLRETYSSTFNSGAPGRRENAALLARLYRSNE